MSTITMELYPAGVTSFLLASMLGAGVQWVDKLNDFRQGRTDMKGLMLLPVGRVGGSPECAKDPRYKLDDIRVFVNEVRAAYGCSKPFPFKVETYSLDVGAELSPAMWRLRRLVPTAPKRKASTSRKLARAGIV